MWSIKEGLAAWGGALATAGDVVFYGTMEGWLKAVNAKTGEVLWKFKTPSGIIGNPTLSAGNWLRKKCGSGRGHWKRRRKENPPTAPHQRIKVRSRSRHLQYRFRKAAPRYAALPVSVVNPAWRTLDSQVRSKTGQRQRLWAQFGAMTLSEDPADPELESFPRRKGQLPGTDPASG